MFTIERAIDTFSPWTLYGVEETLALGLGRNVLERMRRVSVEVFWHWLPRCAHVEYGGVVCPREREVELRVEKMRRIVDVLGRAKKLGFFSVTWKEVAAVRVVGDEVDFEWEVEARRRVLAPLCLLRGVVVLEGDVVAGCVVEREVRCFLARLNRDMVEREEEVESSSAMLSMGLTLEDKRILAELLMGEGQYLLTPEDREGHRKGSYFE